MYILSKYGGLFSYFFTAFTVGTLNGVRLTIFVTLFGDKVLFGNIKFNDLIIQKSQNKLLLIKCLRFLFSLVCL